MKKTITSIDSLKSLFVGLDSEFIAQLLAVIWRVVGAVQLFFPNRDHTRRHRQVRTTVGTLRSGNRSLDHATNYPENRIGWARPDCQLIRIQRRELSTKPSHCQHNRHPIWLDFIRPLVFSKHTERFSRDRTFGHAAWDCGRADDSGACRGNRSLGRRSAPASRAEHAG